MAAFKQHITFSSFLGVGYAGVLWSWGLDLTYATLAGALCGLAGMLPDLDSDRGRPAREITSLTGALAAILLIGRFRRAGIEQEIRAVAAIGVYFFIRFGTRALLRKITVHRGMFHSIPAGLIAAELVFLGHHSTDLFEQCVIAGGVFLGFCSHLVLDEIYSIDASGMQVRLKQSAGSALKLVSSSPRGTFIAWALVSTLGYAVAVEIGQAPPIDWSVFQTEAVAQLFDAPTRLR